MKVAMFDMDGTLLDSMQAWRHCNVEYLEQRGCKIDASQLPHIIQASSGVHLFDYVLKTFGIEIDRPVFRELQKKRMYETYAKGAPVKPGVVPYLTYLRAKGVKTVLTTATWATHTTLALARSGLTPLFDGIFCCDTIGHSKSTPEYFEAVARFCDASLSDCVLFDDAVYAIKSGRAANLLGIVGLTDATNTLFREEMGQYADVVVDSLASLIPSPGN
jgi:HAD superfamily hydrolase (TIGR01509 family)